MVLSKHKVAIVGFGRVGRNLFRMLRNHPHLEVGAIEDPADPVGLTYLLKYDSIYGRYPDPVEYGDGHLYTGQTRVPFRADRNEREWSTSGVSMVVLSTGRRRSLADCRQHLTAGAERVILASTPSSLGEIPLLLRGVNDDILASEPDVVALGSNTSNALAPVLKTLADQFGWRRGFLTSVHAMTNSQRLADVPTSGFRSSRAAADNIIPSPTDTAQILAASMPELGATLSSMAMNVPVVDGSTVDLVAELKSPVSVDEVNEAIREACATRYAGIVEYATDPIVSSDVTGSSYSAVFDSLATMVLDERLVKTVTWYNNGWAYSARIVEVLERMIRR